MKRTLYGQLKRVLIIHGTLGKPQDHPESARVLVNLLGHFNVSCTHLSSSHYSRGMLSGFDALFYLSDTDDTTPLSLLMDIIHTHLPVCWLGKNIEHLAASGRLGTTTISPPGSGEVTIHYRGQALPGDPTNLRLLRVEELTGCRVWAYFEQAGKRYPYALEHKNLWMFAEDPLTGSGGYWVLADLLHEILRERHANKAAALIRIEDVHPQTDPTSLQAIGDYLGQENIPFLVALIPVYANGATKSWIPLSTRPGLVQTLHDLVKKGAMLVLHGYTHQHGEEESAIGFEFWDADSDQPLFGDSWLTVEKRLRQALDECAANNLWPLAFEPPHYAISALGYRVCRAHFSTLVGREQLSDRTYQFTQVFPYPIWRDQYGNRWFPENLGYVNPASGQTVARMLETARQFLVVRDAIAGAFFHPFMPLDLLKQLVDGLRALGFSFTDLRQERHWVRWSGWRVHNLNDQILVTHVPGQSPCWATARRS